MANPNGDGAVPRIHPHEWTRESVARFWDYNARNSQAADQYFTARWGFELVRFAEFACVINGKQILDYGCGPGFLSKVLLDHGAFVTGVEHSVESIDIANQRFQDHRLWKGCRAISEPLLTGHFDMAFCVETIEHPLKDDLDLLFEFLFSALKQGGYAIFTTPNEEDLDANSIACPECGAEFHRWQHVRRWTVKELTERLEMEGFEVVFCEGMSFQPFRKVRSSPRDLSLRTVEQQVKDLWMSVLDRLAPRSFPAQRSLRRLLKRAWSYNLVAVARKPVEVEH